MTQRVVLSSKRMDYGTPLDLFEKLNKVYNFDLDVAASDENHLCPAYFTEACSALDSKCWNTRAFCNPPYGRQLPKFVAKAIEIVNQYDERGNHTGPKCVVFLMPARVGSRWFQELVFDSATAVLFLKGRLTFQGAPNPAPFDSCIVEYATSQFGSRLGGVQLEGQYFELDWTKF